MSACVLCEAQHEQVLWRSSSLRIIDADERAYPGFCRVIWNAHVREMTDLAPEDRTTLMTAVWVVEAVLRQLLQPDKINLASLGNAVPHLHWHVIPRFADDRHFPDAVWASARREGGTHAIDRGVLRRVLEERLGAGHG